MEEKRQLSNMKESTKRNLAKSALNLLGWRIKDESLVDETAPKRCVILLAEHTSYADFPMAKLIGTALGIKPTILVSHVFFEGIFAPLGKVLMWLGCAPLNKTNAKAAMVRVTKDLAKKDIRIAICPEGVLHYIDHWKKGFYILAKTAKAPVIILEMDFHNKTASVLPEVVELTGNKKEDMDKFRRLVKRTCGKYPDKVGQVRLLDE